MALQTGVSTSKVLILVGAGLTSSVILRSGRLSDLISQLQELLKGVDETEISSNKFDSAAVAAQIRQLAQEIKELTVASPITIYNGNSSGNGSYASYLVPAAAIGAVGYCYMWWKGWSLSDVMFVTKQNMMNAVSTVSHQLEHVSQTLAITKKHLSKRLENLDWKLDEQKQISENIANDVNDVKSNLSQIGFDVEIIQQMVLGLEGKLELLENKQDSTNSGLWQLCQLAGSFQEQRSPQSFEDDGGRLPNNLRMTIEDKSSKGLQFISGTDEVIETQNTVTYTKKIDPDSLLTEKVPAVRRIHRSYPVGISLGRGII